MKCLVFPEGISMKFGNNLIFLGQWKIYHVQFEKRWRGRLHLQFWYQRAGNNSVLRKIVKTKWSLLFSSRKLKNCKWLCSFTNELGTTTQKKNWNYLQHEIQNNLLKKTQFSALFGLVLRDEIIFKNNISVNNIEFIYIV